MFTVCIILIVIIVIIKSLGGNRCPKCGSTNIAAVDDGSPVETGCVAVLLAFLIQVLLLKVWQNQHTTDAEIADISFKLK